MMTQPHETLHIMDNRDDERVNSNNVNHITAAAAAAAAATTTTTTTTTIPTIETMMITTCQHHDKHHNHHKIYQRRYTLSLFSLILLGSCFLCTLIGVAFLVYNFATCNHLINAGLNENIICARVPLKHDHNNYNNKESYANKSNKQNNNNNNKLNNNFNKNFNKIMNNNKYVFYNDDNATNAGHNSAENKHHVSGRVKMEKLKNVRLPRSMKPLTYNITITPYFSANNNNDDNDNDNDKGNDDNNDNDNNRTKKAVFTFDGEVHIKILILEDCYNITLHALDLNITKDDVTIERYRNDNDNYNDDNVIQSSNAIDKVTITNLPLNHTKGGKHKFKSKDTNRSLIDDILHIHQQYFVESKQFFIIELTEKLLRGVKYMIKIKFNGLIQDYMQGFYRSSYRTRVNETRWLVSTQFQATDARRAFPCFDEPALKAKFTLNIARPKNMSAISNMPIKATKKHSYLLDYEWDMFAETLPMSTYLIAYSVSDFHNLTKDNFNVWARRDVIESAQYALSIGPKILKYLEEFFNITFPLPKMDMIALPDFQAGAMENWGLITFRETSMLYEESVSETTHKQIVAIVVGHELAHQWFGNLVTPSWWSDLWLNEGFASYMEYLIVDNIEPTWNFMDRFIVHELQNVFLLDALSSSHQISVAVDNPDEISEIFDKISYDKGATIIRMMNHFLTENVFRQGLNRYLREMAFSSAEQNDLWHYLTMEAKMSGLLNRNITVKDIMDTWTLQVGFPVIHIIKHTQSNIVRLEQQRFLYARPNLTLHKQLSLRRRIEEPLWWIPITYTTNEELNFENTQPITWIPKTQIYEIENENLTKASWYIFNIQVTGYYRVNYDLNNWQAIIEYLWNNKTFRNIAPSNRAQLIDDSMNLALGEMLPYEIALNLTKYLQYEDDLAPWTSAIKSFRFLDTMFISQAEYHLLKNYLLKLLQPAYDSVGFVDPQNKSDMVELMKRVVVLEMACHIGNRDCIAESVRHFQNWIQVPNPDTNNPIPPNLRCIVYCTAIEYGTELEWNFAYERFMKTSISSERDLLLSALGCTREPWLLKRYLQYAISDDHNIRKQDVIHVFGAVSSNIIGQQLAFDFIRENWNKTKTYLGSTVKNMNEILKIIISDSNSKYHLKELETFVQEHLREKSRLVQQTIELVHLNVNWMERNYQTIVKWLHQVDHNK